MRGVPLGEIVDFLDGYLEVPTAIDHPNALNGLQVEASGPVKRFAVSVDASEAVIRAVKDWADLLVVHHGLFWGGLQPLTGPHFRRVKALIESGTGLYSAHLPLDSHTEVGNAAVLARALRMTCLEPFGHYRGVPVGWHGKLTEWPDCTLGELASTLTALLGARVVTLPGGPDEISKVGVVTGAGASALEEAAALGLDVLITGEARHHHAIEAAESGVTMLLGGHYATETWGVKKVAEVLTEHFGIHGRFVDSPTGL